MSKIYMISLDRADARNWNRALVFIRESREYRETNNLHQCEYLRNKKLHEILKNQKNIRR